MRRLPVVVGPTAGAAHPEPPVRGQRWLEVGESLLLRLQRITQRALPEHLDPLAQAGAIANTSLIVAIASGVLLLVWYSPSVHQAHASLEALRGMTFTGQLVRSLHRYSSDACLLFALLHATQSVFARRFSRSRWLAWVTGVALVGLLWLVGWLGYWLVWDQRAQLVAVGTAKLFDGVPLFAEPLSRSFLADESVSSLLFFVVFFFHMLVPLVMGVALWLHITRLNRARFLTPKPLTIWLLVSMVAISLAHPATSAEPARMTTPPSTMTLDAWFLLPVALTDRLSGGLLWALALVSGIFVFSVPRWAARGRAVVAEVNVAKCNSCRQCYEDCPYDAISMAPRTDGRSYEEQAQINASRCVGCGICAGSCDSSAIALPWLGAVEVRRRVDAWIEEPSNDKPFIAFVCASSAASGFRVDPLTGACPDLSGYRAFAVPCSGWVHSLTVERALRHGARGVLVVGCGAGEVPFREGPRWTSLRLGGKRSPKLRRERVDVARVRFVRLDRSRRAELLEEATRFLKELTPRAPSLSRIERWGSVAAVVLGLSALVLAGSDAPYSAPSPSTPELVVSFKHPGKVLDQCRRATEAEKAALPVHMRRDEICERGRAKVRVRVTVDGARVVDKTYAAGGIWGDGTSVATETIGVASGSRAIRIALGDTSDTSEWTYETARVVPFSAAKRVVVLFDKLAGFTWHGADETTDSSRSARASGALGTLLVHGPEQPGSEREGAHAERTRPESDRARDRFAVVE